MGRLRRVAPRSERPPNNSPPGTQASWLLTNARRLGELPLWPLRPPSPLLRFPPKTPVRATCCFILIHGSSLPTPPSSSMCHPAQPPP